jgi:squalene-hopene/tetraprenyl-beta-curcumene cyclase
MSPSLQLTDALVGSCSQTLRQAVNFLLAKQHRDGYWWADLTADTTLESDYILLELWRHPPVDGVWNPPTRERVGRAVRSILARQLPDGGFNIYAHGPSEISASVKAYTALKSAGACTGDGRVASSQ